MSRSVLISLLLHLLAFSLILLFSAQFSKVEKVIPKSMNVKLVIKKKVINEQPKIKEATTPKKPRKDEKSKKSKEVKATNKEFPKKLGNKKEDKKKPLQKKKKDEKERDIFEVKEENNIENEEIDAEDINIIKAQVESIWNMLSCQFVKHYSIKIFVEINKNCEVVNSINMNAVTSNKSSTACTQSAMRAVQEIGTVNLDKDKCAKYSKKGFVLNFRNE